MSQNPCPKCRSDRPSLEGVCPNCGWKPNDVRKERELMIRMHADPRVGVERGSRNTRIVAILVGMSFHRCHDRFQSGRDPWHLDRWIQNFAAATGKPVAFSIIIDVNRQTTPTKSRKNSAT